MDENYTTHPVPQNVTSFEFHLVGDMTLKQFAYLAIGLCIAYLIFVFFGNNYPYIAWPLMAVFSATGAAFAFLPIGERPLDHWMAAFVRAIFKPTQLKFKSTKISPEDPNFKNRLKTYLNEIHHAPTNSPIYPVIPPIQKTITPPTQQAIKQMVQQTQAAPPPPPTKVITYDNQSNKTPSNEDLKETVELAGQAQQIQAKILETEKELNIIKTSAAQPGADPTKFAQEFQQLLDNLSKLNKEATDVSKDLAEASKTVTKQVVAIPAKVVKRVPAMKLTSFANIVNGIVTDSQGSYLEGAIVVAHDRQGIPVRALKTNKLGQFIAATPLPNGVYTITVEKDQLGFDAIEVELDGKVLDPVLMPAH